MDAAAEADRIELEKSKIESQERIAGVQAGAKVASEKAKLEGEMELRGVELGSSIAKQRWDMQHQDKQTNKPKGK
jgi:hypothetical protein